MPRVLARPLLVAALCQRVWGKGRPFAALDLRQALVVSVDRRAGCVHHPRNSASSRSLEDIQRAPDVVFAVSKRVLEGTADAAPGGLVKNAGDAGAGRLAGRQIPDVAFDKLVAAVAQQEIDICPAARRKVVKATDTASLRTQGMTEVGAYEPRAACH